MKTFSSRLRGFTLLELMIVVLIIGIIAMYAVPAASTILRGSSMTQASQILADQLSLARQYALTTNHPVEVRFIRFADPEMPGEAGGTPSSGQYRAIQIMGSQEKAGSDTPVMDPLDKAQMLPQSIVINQSSLSTLISEAGSAPIVPSTVSQPLTSDPALPRIGKNYDYIYIHFMPDGSTNLPSKSATDPNGAWFVSLQNITDAPNPTGPPPNFYTVQIDPVSGTMKQFRPGI